MKYNLKTVCTKIGSGATPKGGKEAYCTDGISLIRSQNILDYRFSKEGLAYISDEQAKKLNNVEVCEGDVLLNITGDSVARVCISDKNYLPARVNQHVAIIRPNNKKLLSSYLLYFLQLKKDYLLQISSAGATRNALTKKMIEELEIELPSLAQQKQVVAILELIREKIAINQQINDNLEQQAQALFQSWFVDYTPNNGQIPDNWKLYYLKDFLPVITGKKNANVSSNAGEYPFFSCSQDISWTDLYSFDGNAILVAGNGDFNVKFYNGKFEAYQRTYVLIPDNSRYTAWLYYAIKYNLQNITSAARGSVIKFITKGNLEDFSFYAPENLDDFQLIDVFACINDSIATVRKENQKLAEIRDNLLPKLMSGEIDVSSIQL